MSDARWLAAPGGPTADLLIRYDVPEDARATIQVRRSDSQPLVAKQGAVTIMAVRATEIARQLREIHDAGPWATMALSRAASALLLMGTTIKGRQQVGIQINGDGPLGEVYGN